MACGRHTSGKIGVVNHQEWQAPPGWPTPPPAWAPQSGWRPDPSWPAPPEGWQWWQPVQETKWERHKLGLVIGLVCLAAVLSQVLWGLFGWFIAP